MPYLVGYITPQDYGAVADGVTDDTAAIQAAINAAGVKGAGVFFPATTASYLLNSTGLTVSSNDVSLIGESTTNAQLTIGASFTGSAAITITGSNCQVRDLSFFGASTTTTSNPAADAIKISGVRRTRVNRCTFYYINGWCVETLATSGSSTTNPVGTQLSQLYMNQCAAGLHFQGNTTQAWAMNCSVTDVQSYLGGVTTGTYANLDVIKVEDAWDVLLENVIAWMSNGSGSALRVRGNCAATFVKNLDALGPSSGTGANVLIEDSVNGSPQNVQIDGGVIQQGNTGITITGAATHVHVDSVRVINNRTHGVSVAGTASPIYLRNVFFSLSGQGAAGTNYDLNWSGSSTGAVTDCYFSSPITAIGVAGVQQSVNVASGQDVTFINAVFAGTGATSSNWFTNTPGAALVDNNQRFNFRTRVDFAGQIATQPSTTSAVAFSTNVAGTQTFDNVRLLGDGTLQIGAGSSNRDVQVTRSAAGTLAQTNPLAGVAAYNITGANPAGALQTVTNSTSSPTQANVLWIANAAGDVQLGVAVAGDTNNRYTVDSNGREQYGPGNATPDTVNGRAAAGVWYTSKNLLVGAATALGDNGVGEIQLKDATTVPTTNPTAGSVIYSQSTAGIPIKIRDINGNVRGMVDSYALATADQSTTSATQVASTYLTIPVEASATYLMEAGVICTNTVSGNLVFSWTGPTGATMKWNDTTASLDYSSTIGGTNSYASNANTRLAFFKGKLIVSTTAGSLTLTFSNSAGSSVSILQDSWLRLTRIK